MLGVPETIHKDKVCVAIYYNLTSDTIRHVILSLLKKCILHKI